MSAAPHPPTLLSGNYRETFILGCTGSMLSLVLHSVCSWVMNCCLPALIRPLSQAWCFSCWSPPSQSQSPGPPWLPCWLQPPPALLALGLGGSITPSSFNLLFLPSAQSPGTVCREVYPSEWNRIECVYVYTHIYIHIDAHIYTYILIYTYINDLRALRQGQ